MEIAIPFLALSGMYIISKSSISNNNNRNDEEFTNMGQSSSYLPNVTKISRNYPTTNEEDLSDTVQHYANPNTATDKYFNQSIYENRVKENLEVGNNIQEIHSLTGDYVETNNFKHNNMVPFNGRKVRGNTYNSNMAETLLDNMNGSGSQMIEKTEQAPLFKPEDNISWTHGAPNQSDFFQSRVNPATRLNNIKPFESEHVGPGLNQGYSKEGFGGFNSGMESRDKWLPPTVDELRVVTNPKLEYDLANYEGPANSNVKNVGIMGKMEKHLPEKHYENTADRWFTTTGSEKRETMRPAQEQGNVKRANKAENYKGVAGPGIAGEKSYIKGVYEQSGRIEPVGGHLSIANAVGRGPNGSTGDKKSYKLYSNNRTTTIEPNFTGAISGAFGAVVSPIMDFLRPSLKEETINNVRMYGDASSRVPEMYVVNPNDKTNTTMKETTIYAPTFNINNQKEGIYVNNYKHLDDNHRSTSLIDYTGIAGSDYGARSYTAELNQNNNEIKAATINNRINQGGTQMFNQQMNLTTQHDDTSRYDNRVNAPTHPTGMIPSAERYGNFNPGQKEQAFDTNRIDTSMLDAFKKNPYTHSLSSVA